MLDYRVKNCAFYTILGYYFGGVEDILFICMDGVSSLEDGVIDV